MNDLFVLHHYTFYALFLEADVNCLWKKILLNIDKGSDDRWCFHYKVNVQENLKFSSISFLLFSNLIIAKYKPFNYQSAIFVASSICEMFNVVLFDIQA